MLNIRSIIYGQIASGRCRKLLQCWMICLNDDIEIVCDHRRVWRRLYIGCSQEVGVLAYAKFMGISLKKKAYFTHANYIHISSIYVPKRSITFNSCPIESKFAHFEVINILHFMPSQRCNQSLATFLSQRHVLHLTLQLLRLCI